MGEAMSAFPAEAVDRALFLVEPDRGKFLAEKRGFGSDLAKLSRGNILVREPNPVRFLALFFAALETGHAVTLADPEARWPGSLEGYPALEWWERHGSDWVRCGTRGVCPRPGEILIPTGGTTGAPRLVRHDFSTLRAAAGSLLEWIGNKPLSSLCVLPLFHVGGLMQVVRALVSGGVVYFADWKAWLLSGGPPPGGDEIAVSLVFTQLERLLAHPEGVENLRGYSHIFLGGSGGEGFNVLDRCRQAGLPLALSYGMTETAAMITLQPPAAFAAGHRTAGRPLPGVELEVEQAGGEPVRSGRLRVRAPGLFKGYWGEPGRVPGAWWATADHGRSTPQGWVVEGRMDRLIKSGGKLVDPAAVEQTLQALPGVEAAVVLGLPDPEWGMRIIGVVQAPVESSVTGRSLLQALRGQLAPHEIPKELHLVAFIPRRPTGKVDWEEIRRIVGR